LIAPDPTISRPFGFRSDLRGRVERETEDLLRRRLEIACWVGAALFPPYALQDLKLLDQFPVDAAPGAVVAIRLAASGFLVAMALGLRLARPTGRWLTLIDVLVFGGISWLVAYFVALFWGHVADFYVGVIQVMMVRAIFLPGGWRRALPTLLVSFLAFPLSLFLWCPGTPAEVIAVDPALFGTANTALLVFLLFGVVGSVMYDRLQSRTLRAEHEGKYRVEAVLGRGGGGIVYRAWHNRLDMPCAIKVIPAGEGAAAVEARRRFEREARLTSQLRSQHIVRIFDFGESEDGDPYYAMELLDGWSLQGLVESWGPQPAGRVIHLLRQACDGLGEAHGRGLIHRDIKPANLFVLPTPDELDRIKILDFGVVKSVGESADAGLTQDGVAVGTPTYMAPEQIVDEGADARSDVYALGGVAHFLLTGQPPFGGGSAIAVMHRKLVEEVASPGEAYPHLDIPDDLSLIVLRCLSRSPEDRPPSAALLRAALDACGAAGSWQPADAESWWSTRGEAAGGGGDPEATQAQIRAPRIDSGAETVGQLERTRSPGGGDDHS
jgi:eukaryotic-like serine/threonine-protein kinase